MSRTDNTNPLLIQWDDQTKVARVSHTCGGWRNKGPLECSYSVHNNMLAYTDGIDRIDCQRVTNIFGGKRGYNRAGRPERKQRQRRMRQRERAALYKVRASNYIDDFDLLPVREDCDTLCNDLKS